MLGLILTGAALKGASIGTTLLLLAYALGAATSLALALLVGGRVYQAMKNSLGIGEWVRRGVGVLVLVAVVAIGFGLDTGFLTQASLASTGTLEQSLIDRFQPQQKSASAEGGAMSSSVVMPKEDGEPAGGAMMSANDAMRDAAMKGGAMSGGAMNGGA